MSRRDSLHDAARRTLEKDGWTITDDPLILILEKTLLKADLGLKSFSLRRREIRRLRSRSKTLIRHLSSAN